MPGVSKQQYYRTRCNNYLAFNHCCWLYGFWSFINFILLYNRQQDTKHIIAQIPLQKDEHVSVSFPLCFTSKRDKEQFLQYRDQFCSLYSWWIIPLIQAILSGGNSPMWKPSILLKLCIEASWRFCWVSSCTVVRAFPPSDRRDLHARPAQVRWLHNTKWRERWPRKGTTNTLWCTPQSNPALSGPCAWISPSQTNPKRQTEP